MEATSNCDWLENWMPHTLHIRGQGDIWLDVIRDGNISKANAQLIGSVLRRMRACDAQTLQFGWDAAVVMIYSWLPTRVISTVFDDLAGVMDDSKSRDKRLDITKLTKGGCRITCVINRAVRNEWCAVWNEWCAMLHSEEEATIRGPWQDAALTRNLL